MKKQPVGLLEKLLKNREDEAVFVERHIDIDVHDLEPSPQNFYSMSNIDRLKNLIKTTGKVEELTVKPIGKSKYMVVAGHRRRKVWNYSGLAHRIWGNENTERCLRKY